MSNTNQELGDVIESALSRVGVTKDKVRNWLGLPCNCAERQEKLNQLSRWARMVLAGTLRGAGTYLERFLGEK